MSTAAALAGMVQNSGTPDPFHKARVVTVNGDGTADLDYLGATYPGIPCADGNVPPAESLVCVLMSRNIGWLVLCRFPNVAA